MIRTDEERALRAAWARRRRRLNAYHQWAPFVDPAPARAHVAALREFGLSLESIALMAGEHPSALSTLMLANHHGYQHQIRPAREAAILAVRFDLDHVPDGRWVSAAGTRRRIQALGAMGWSQHWIADQLGVTVQAVGSYRTPKRARVFISTARTIRDLYEGRSMTTGPCVRAARWAKSRGWAPPLAWDNIDDPTEQPNLGATVDLEMDDVAILRATHGDRVHLTKPERVVAVTRLKALGLTDDQVADRLAVTSRTVLRDRTANGIPAGRAA
jgi:transcriptional regulator